jgi:glycosyltransferase involved in cell wall biosynthesis
MPSALPISVIIPCFNSEGTLLRTLESVTLQTLLPSEIIVIDDCSDDNTLVIANLFALTSQITTRISVQPENSGAAAARNAGMDIAIYPYIAFLDSDDTWHSQKLEIQYSVFQRYPGYDLLGHRMVANINHLHASACIQDEVFEIAFGDLLFKNYFNTPTVMMRTTPLRFNAEYRFAEDYQFWLTLSSEGMRLGFINTPLAMVHKNFFGSSGLSGSLWKMEKGELRCLQNMYQSKKISLFTYFIAGSFSLVKFAKRAITVAVRRSIKTLDL